MNGSAPDLIVVGSGLGGLCAGAIASCHGLEVLVLEAHSQPGGAAQVGAATFGYAGVSGSISGLNSFISSEVIVIPFALVDQ